MRVCTRRILWLWPWFPYHLVLVVALVQQVASGAPSAHDPVFFFGNQAVVPLRGGSSSSEASISETTDPSSSVLFDASLLPSTSRAAPPLSSSNLSSPSYDARTKNRASDMIQELIDRSSLKKESDTNEESLIESRELRRLVMERTLSQLRDIHEAVMLVGQRDETEKQDEDHEEDDDFKLPDPRRLLSYLAPKIPAIRHSPDASLRIQSNPNSLDPGVSACVIASLAHVVVVRDKAVAQLEDYSMAGHGKRQQQRIQRYRDENMSALIVKERRLEQLLECLLCGVNVQSRMKEYTQQKIDHDADAATIEELLQPASTVESTTTSSGGLSIRDAARAAWGLALLIGAHHHQDSMGGEKVSDIFVALSLLIRERLLEKSQELRQGDLSSLNRDVDGRIADLSTELAEDVASAMWAFGCVRACTGLQFAPLFEVGCMILCQNPFDMRKRAQESVDGDIVGANVGANDIVDRLARSDGEPSSIDYGSSAGRDTLLDFLSPNQVTDVLWALALHGSRSHESSSQEEIALSETAATFREIACDRLIVWLQAELENVQTHKSTDHTALQDESADVYDSPSSLVQDAYKVEETPVVIEDMTIGDSSADSGVQHVQVIDAATVMASEMNHRNAQAGESLSLTDVSSETKLRHHSISFALNKGRLLQTFSPRDLCSIAWAVTELHDSLQTSVTQIVISIFFELGPESLLDLEGRDLSNLAWAIAKSRTDSGSSFVDSSMQLASWIADVMVPIERSGNFISLSRLSKLQPPELGRLVWAVATCYSSMDSPVSHLSESIPRLALAALYTAADNFSGYGSEDLARIAWGFIELCETETLLDNPTLASSLGIILSTIKASLLDWENGSLQNKPEESYSSRNPFSFSSFFGRARFLAQLLDQRTDEPLAEEGDEFSLSLLTKKTLPLLKDLPLDPSTLCKITSAFGKLRISGGEVFARVALRLMTSRSGRLLRECPMSDLVRLCETVASEKVPLGRERVSLFVRKLVHLFNTEWASGDSYTLTSGDAALLIWSLGELGVKSISDAGPDDIASAHRRLHLLGSLPLDRVQTRSLSTPNAVKLLTGLMSTHLALTQPDKTRETLEALSQRVMELDGKNIGLLAEVVAKLRYLVAESNEATAVMTSNLETNSSVTVSTEGDAIPFGEQSGLETETLCFTIIMSECDRMLSLLAQQSISMISIMTAEELRRLVSVYTLSPFRADELVAAVSREVEARLQLLESLPVDELSLETRLKSLARQAEAFLKPFHVGEAPGFGATIRSGLSSFFRGREEVESGANEVNASETEQTEELKQILSSIVDISERVSTLSSVAGSLLDDSCRYIAQSAAFELGRCKELIAHYNRIDFETGKRKSRHIYDDKRTLAKQVLSRLLP